MTNKSMGEIIAALRREKGMTQKELADMLNITDKAVSKWERGLALPDTAAIPKLAEIFGVPVEELINAKASSGGAQRRGAGNEELAKIVNIILKAVPLAMGVAVTVAAILGELDTSSGFAMLGIGLTCIGIYQFKAED